MTVLPIRLFGDPVLRTPAQAVTDFDKQLRQLVADLTETMLHAPGVGLAAPQLGVGLRVFTYHVDEEQSGHLVNPVLHFPPAGTGTGDDADEQDGPEGCLSLPGLSFDCKRRNHVVAHGQNMYGDPVSIEGTALLARCIQHESDHLDGVLFIDRLDPVTKKAAMKAIREAEWSGLNHGPAGGLGTGTAPRGGPASKPVSNKPVIKVSPH